MTAMLEQPDIVLGLEPDQFAPRAARQAIGRAGDASPDLRDAIALLASNIVTRATGGPGRIELRGWMAPPTVRVEVLSPTDPFEPPLSGPAQDDYDVELLDGLADRWGVERLGARTVVWFEIERREPGRGRFSG